MSSAANLVASPTAPKDQPSGETNANIIPPTASSKGPTAGVAEGIVSVFGFFYRAVMMGDISEIAWKYFTCTIPVAATFAPIGSFLGSHLHRQVIAALIYLLEIASLIGFLLTKPSWLLILASGIIIFCGFAFFTILAKSGEYLMARVEKISSDKEFPTTTTNNNNNNNNSALKIAMKE